MTRSVVTIHDHVFSSAVRHHWSVRDRQLAEQRQRGGSDQGSRAQVTGGKQMDGFAAQPLGSLAATLEYRRSKLHPLSQPRQLLIVERLVAPGDG